MPSVTAELVGMINESSSQFCKYHYGETELFEQFVKSTGDENRLRLAEECAEIPLQRVDAGEFAELRLGVLRREASGQISFASQRDHSVHTLNNYLLGWYIYDKCPTVRTELAAHFAKRQRFGGMNDFANVWHFVSLLHDLGYLFEGSAAPLQPSPTSKDTLIGVGIVNDFLENSFWLSSKIYSPKQRDILARLVREIPVVRGPTLSSIAGSLEYLGDITPLLRQLKKSLGSLQTMPNAKKLEDGLARSVWTEHFISYGQASMAKLVVNAMNAFEGTYRDGVNGRRMLDHGVCSGLLLLKLSTLYFNVYFAAKTKLKGKQVRRVADACGAFCSSMSPGVVIHANWWWGAIVWATAATMLHNVLTLEASELPKRVKPLQDPQGLLALTDDPLTFLGILVDALQEWDRYRVSGEGAFSSTATLDSSQVSLSASGGKIEIDYCSLTVSQKVRQTLDRTLKGWAEIVDVQPRHHKEATSSGTSEQKRIRTLLAGHRNHSMR